MTRLSSGCCGWGLPAASMAVATGLLLWGCGAKSGLLLYDGDAGGLLETPRPDAGDSDAFPAADAIADTSVADQAVPDSGGEDAPVPLKCVLQPAGPPMAFGSFPEQHAEAPSLAVIDPGSPGVAANVAIQAYRSGGSDFEHAIFAGRFTVGDAWPDSVTWQQPLIKVGTDSHGWAEMTLAPGGLRELAFAWLGDPGGATRTMFRTVDADSWAAHDPVDLSNDGSSALGLAAGAGLGDMGVGYAGIGYGIVWRLAYPNLPDSPMSPVVAVLDTDGQLLLGPHRVAEPEEYPGRSPAIGWSGSAYLLATSFGDCVPGDPLCVPDSVVITRVRPASGDAWDDSGVDFVAAIPAASPDWVPRRPGLASDGVDTYVAWSEGIDDPDDNVRAIRLARLDSQGNPVGEPAIVATGIPLLQSVRLDVSAFGISVIWAEEGDTSLQYNDVGRSRIAVSLHDRDLTPLGPAVRIPTTQFGSYGWASGASIDQPRSLLVTWPGYPDQGGMEISWLARLDCVDQPTADAGPDSAGGGEYFAAMGPIGALDRFFIAKRDVQRDLCFRIGLAHPMDPWQYDIATPAQWGVEHASAMLGADKCAEPPWTEPIAQCTAATGAIDFQIDEGQWMPCAVSVNATLAFDGTQPWAPLQEPMSAANIPVSGACGQP